MLKLLPRKYNINLLIFLKGILNKINYLFIYMTFTLLKNPVGLQLLYPLLSCDIDGIHLIGGCQ